MKAGRTGRRIVMVVATIGALVATGQMTPLRFAAAQDRTAVVPTYRDSALILPADWRRWVLDLGADEGVLA
jgi:hypothetical protein